MSRSAAHSSRYQAGSRLVVLAALGLSLAACASDQVVQTGSIYPYDYRERHPIVLTDMPTNLDIFARGLELDQRQRDDVKSFAASYRTRGKGAIAVQVPKGDSRAHGVLDAIRGALSEGGIPGRTLRVTSYQPTDPGLAAPIRLSFMQMQAKVDSKCGLWPQDLGVSNAGFNLRNEPYWNHGCATQSNVAAQIADPVDLVRGRTAGAIDPIRRSNNIEKLRDGNDPSTNYRQDGKGQINQAIQ